MTIQDVPGCEDLRRRLAPRLAAILAVNLTRRHPYQDSHVFRTGEGPVQPATSHPAFCNSYDWHSSVHSHWTAVHLLEYAASQNRQPATTARLARALATNLTPERLAAERAYLVAHPTYERPYGWAWAMMLAAAVHRSALAHVRPARAPLRRLTAWIARAAVRWLHKLPGPVRHGTHANTAFACGLMLDATDVLRCVTLRRAIARRALAWFADDVRYPHAWERSAHDFLSPGLTEADLMRRILPPAPFRRWWRRFMPDVRPGSALCAPVEVPAGADGQIGHLHGLNLSRAGALARLAVALSRRGSAAEERTARALVADARRLYEASVGRALDRDYSVTHWLGTFAWDAAASIDDAVRLLGPATT